MVELFVYLGLAALLVAGVLALARPRTISAAQYEEMKGKGSSLGNAMHALQEVLDPLKAEALRKAKTEIVQEQPSGDPPADPPAGEAAPDAGRKNNVRSPRA